MEIVPFRQLPLVVKIAVGVAFSNAWASTEEFVVDRYGLWKYMPFYRVAKPCVWDLAVGSIIWFVIWRLARSPVIRQAG